MLCTVLLLQDVANHGQPIRALQLQSDMAVRDVGSGACYCLAQDSDRRVPHLAILWPASPKGDCERG